MSQQDPELEAFAKFIGAIEPWVGEVVLIGGWAHRLYRLHPLARKLEYLPLTTIDGDVAVPPKLKAQELTVRERLLAAGFKEEFVGEDRPPATHYHYGKDGGFYAEFLTPLVGSEYDRSGKRKATTEVSGISSQLLRYIEMLMISPWKVELGKENGYPFSPRDGRWAKARCGTARRDFSSRSKGNLRAKMMRILPYNGLCNRRGGYAGCWRKPLWESLRPFGADLNVRVF